MPTITKEIISLPTVKVFAMTDASNHPFIISFHTNDFDYGDIYFKVTPNRSNPVTIIPVFAGVCYSINSFMDMLTTYGCKYIKRLPIESGEILSKDYLDGLADGAITATPTSTSHSDDDNEDEWLYDFIGDLLDDDLFDEVDESDLPF